MKTSRILIAAMAVASLAGCAKEYGENTEAGSEITITATIAENQDTRTVLDGTSVLWEPGDEVKLFYDGTGSRLTSTLTSASGVSSFSGTFNGVIGFNEGFSDSTPLYGLYPYRADATADNTSVTTTLPSEQTGKAGSFAKGMNLSLGKSTSLSMGFYNVCGGVRFSLTQTGIKEVIFEGRNDESLAGKVKLAFSENIPVVSEVVTGEKSITLTAPGGGSFETGKWYYIVALPGTLSSGFKLTFNTDTQYAIKKSSSSVTIRRGIFGSLEDIDEGLVFVDKGTEPTGDNIVFKDNAAKFACVAKFDKDKDGEVSFEEAEAATSFSGLFTDWKGVTSFDEISYFKNVHSLSGVFSGCTKLASITVPDNITELGTCAFDGCSSLASVVLPSDITSIGDYTFQNCSKLESVEIPSKVTSIGLRAFSGCSSLKSLELPSGVTSLGNYAFSGCSSMSSVDLPAKLATISSYAFQNCSSLSTINLPSKLSTISSYAFSGAGLTAISIPDGVTSLGSYAFYGCSSLETANIPSGISSVPQYCFYNCSSLTSVSIPSGVSSVGSNAFSGVTMWKLELPSTITTLGSGCFGNIVCVILPSTTPVSIQSNTFIGVQGIFVPSNLIEMYKVMTNWSDYSSKIHPITEFKANKKDYYAQVAPVDMGTSVKWAPFNVGAISPEGYGDYYAWGETETKSDYSSSTYFDSSYSTYFNGTGGKTQLESDDDVAHTEWGGSWRMPTDAEWTELRTNCNWTWTSKYGVNGYEVTSTETGNSIFLPAAGYRYDTNLYYVGSDGDYWSSSLNSYNSYLAWYVYFYSYGVLRNIYDRYYGLSVRPVSE